MPLLGHDCISIAVNDLMNRNMFSEAVDGLCAALAKLVGIRAIAVYCRKAQHRAPVLAASMLCKMGAPLDDAIRHVERLRVFCRFDEDRRHKNGKAGWSMRDKLRDEAQGLAIRSPELSQLALAQLPVIVAESEFVDLLKARFRKRLSLWKRRQEGYRYGELEQVKAPKVNEAPKAATADTAPPWAEKPTPVEGQANQGDDENSDSSPTVDPTDGWHVKAAEEHREKQRAAVRSNEPTAKDEGVQTVVKAGGDEALYMKTRFRI